MNRKLNLVYTPAAHQGFMGPDHTARAIMNRDFSQTDPFILLMDDFLDKKDTTPVGGPHPHAGFETVSLLLEGEMGDDEYKMRAGDFQIMTAGSGVVHTETIDKKARMRLLQMWITLPDKYRWVNPRLQHLSLRDVPVVTDSGSNIRVYSGSFAGIVSPVDNYVPLIVADIVMQPGTEAKHALPSSFNTFLYVIEGEVKVGEEQKLLKKDQVGWLDSFSEPAQSGLLLVSGDAETRVIMYSAEPQHENIVSHGPFIANTEAEIQGLYRKFREGKMNHIHTLPEDRLITL
ncbi:MAG TPA: pirin-like C-terminal cupin domain-containing protein [Cyclobacteriaceae bacterium]|nr:pirin-like C-terminal cupin domain-containing protein [Cyclobacteriaceae bacterium]